MQVTLNFSPQQYVPKMRAGVPQTLNVNQNINGGVPIALQTQQCSLVQINNPQHDNLGNAQNNPIKVLINGVQAEELPAGTIDFFQVNSNMNEISVAFVGAAQVIHATALFLPTN